MVPASVGNARLFSRKSLARRPKTTLRMRISMLPLVGWPAGDLRILGPCRDLRGVMQCIAMVGTTIRIMRRAILGRSRTCGEARRCQTTDSKCVLICPELYVGSIGDGQLPFAVMCRDYRQTGTPSNLAGVYGFLSQTPQNLLMLWA